MKGKWEGRGGGGGGLMKGHGRSYRKENSYKREVKLSKCSNVGNL